MPSPSKDELRRQLSARRRARPPDELAAARTAIVRALSDELTGIGCVAAYEPLRTEPGSIELLQTLTGLGIRVLVPITLADRDLDWRRWPDGVPLGPDAIADAEAVLVPALAVARDGTRLGRGGGSYDRALPRCSPDAVITALLFDDELVDQLPAEPWDVEVHAVVQPTHGWRALPLN